MWAARVGDDHEAIARGGDDLFARMRAAAPLQQPAIRRDLIGPVNHDVQPIESIEMFYPEPELAGGLFRSSDLAELKDGLVFLRGRANDLINVAGRKVSPETIERELLTHPEVRDCLVFGAPGPETGRTETIVACVAVKSGAIADELRHYLLAKLPAWQVPRQWRFVDSLETSHRGKISRAERRRRFLEQSP